MQLLCSFRQELNSTENPTNETDSESNYENVNLDILYIREDGSSSQAILSVQVNQQWIEILYNPGSVHVVVNKLTRKKMKNHL